MTFHKKRQTLLVPPLDDMLLIYPKDRRGEEKREEKRRKLHEYQSLQVHNIPIQEVGTVSQSKRINKPFANKKMKSSSTLRSSPFRFHFSFLFHCSYPSTQTKILTHYLPYLLILKTPVIPITSRNRAMPESDQVGKVGIHLKTDIQNT